jgi:Lon protease-like protein
MVQYRGTPEKEGEEVLHKIGCAGRLTRFSEADDGRYIITLSGISRFRLQSSITGFTPYLKYEIDWTSFVADISSKEIDTSFNRPAFLALLDQFLSFAGLSTDWENLKDADEETLINTLSMLCPFSAEEKQALLEAPNLQNRRETLTSLMQFAMMGDNGDKGKMQ